jgi:predicted DNA-binding transcriptional regulator YafY
MNNIYNEIYGLYYFMLEKILEKAKDNDITLKEINQIVSQYGFSESSIYFTPEVTSQTEGYNLLRATNSGYSSILKSKPTEFLTNIQESFIKSILKDKRIHLFLSGNMVRELSEALLDTKPLFNIDDITHSETALDSDNYSDEKYTSSFKTILQAIRNQKALKICFNSSKGERKTLKVMPYKFEYGVRDDKFRLCGVSIFSDNPRHYVKINLSRILSVSSLNQSYDVDFDSFINKKKKPEPIEIEVSNMRNGFERVFISLSNYERVSSFNEETGKCSIKIYYTDDDEQELLILLMSFGPAIKVLGPLEFKERFIERIRKQLDILK